MGTLNFTLAGWFQGHTEKPLERVRPQPPRPGPVLIHDCIAPVSGTTLLHLLWQRQEAERKDQ